MKRNYIRSIKNIFRCIFYPEFIFIKFIVTGKFRYTDLAFIFINVHLKLYVTEKIYLYYFL